MTHDHDLPVPRCYYAVPPNLLLQDLSDSHTRLENELPPTESQSYQLVETLAKLHAHWWEWEGPKTPAALPESMTKEFDEDVKVYRAFTDSLGDHILPAHRAIFDRVIDRFLSVRRKRFADQRHLTLTHGDAHAWNFLYPKSDGALPVLLDWEAFGVNLGPLDLAYLMAIFWHPARRSLLEKSLVKHYHQRLGVPGYSWGDCWYDYRLSVVNLLFMLAWWWSFRMPAYLWWYRLERLMMAYEDLNCAELLD